LLHAAFQVGRGAQQLAALGEQLLSGLCQHRTVSFAVEELNAERSLQLPYGVSDR
jgi:hypothetical protein